MLDGQLRQLYFSEHAKRRVFESDIILGAELQPNGSQQQLPGRRWPDGRIPYVFKSGFAGSAVLLEAMAHWHSKTPVRFIARSNESDYVEISNADGLCAATLGRLEGRQELLWDAACSPGVAVHLLGHVVGLHHEHTRTDRDAFITVSPENLASGLAHAFDKYTQSSGVEAEPYDLDSVMHFGSYDLSKNGSPTLVKKSGALIFRKSELSARDVRLVEKMYSFPKPPPACNHVIRYAGGDAFENAAVIAGVFAGDSEEVVLVTGDATLPDAAVGAQLAAHYRGRLLFTRSDILPLGTRLELERLKPQRVTIVGGTVTISTDIEADITALGIPVERFSGANRYDTATSVALAINSDSRIAVVAAGDSPEDALLAGALSARFGGKWPVLYTRATSLPAVTATTLTSLNRRYR